MKVNLYEQPDIALSLIRSILSSVYSSRSHYAEGLFNVALSSISGMKALPPSGERTRMRRKILLLWCILYKAGFAAN
jgi:hypothetical protein